jgi:hypothetical protein
MKQNRRRRHFRPRPSRSQINHGLQQLERTLNLLRVEAALELRRPEPSIEHLRCLEHRVLECQEAMSYLETY